MCAICANPRSWLSGSQSTVHTEWQWPLSGVHSIMLEKLAQAGEGGGCTPTPFHYIYHHVAVYGTLQLRWQIHSRYFISTPICTLWSCLRHRNPPVLVKIHSKASQDKIFLTEDVEILSPAARDKCKHSREENTVKIGIKFTAIMKQKY